ncbi:MAG: hypothetical protein ACREV3_04665 [Gammaproteobacteria bacterium]
MKMHQLSRLYLFHLFAIVASVALPLDASAAGPTVGTFRIQGIGGTGFNERCGEPRFSLPPPFLPDFHGAFVGEFDPTPDAVAAIPLTPTNCDDDILLATTTDPVFLGAAGLPDADPRIKNIPLRDALVIVTPDGVRASIPPLGALPPNPIPPVKSEPNDPITLGTWLKARGHMTITCKEDGSARVRARFEKLIPNGVYTMWGLWKTTPPGAPGPMLVPFPLGGVPNSLVPDEDGDATFKRTLALCPMDSAPDGSQLLFAALAYHSDSSLYGGVTGLALGNVEFRAADGSTFTSNLAPGTIGSDQIEFPITVSRFPN